MWSRNALQNGRNWLVNMRVYEHVRTTQVQQSLRNVCSCNFVLCEEAQMHAIAGIDEVAPSWRWHRLVNILHCVACGANQNGTLQHPSFVSNNALHCIAVPTHCPERHLEAVHERADGLCICELQTHNFV